MRLATSHLGRLRFGRICSIALFVAGLLIAAFPFVSVSRLQNQVLDEVPIPGRAAVLIEGQPARPLFDDDFVLAYRGVGASVDDVRRTLLDAGFEPNGPLLEGRSTFARPCCGEYDAVMVSVFEGRDGITGLRYSVTDRDLAAFWWVITGFGALVALTGLALLVPPGSASSRRSAESTAGAKNGETPVSAS